MSLTSNPYGDLEITDSRALRALAHPTRVAILERLQRYGPSTATQLSPYVGATPSVVSWHLRHLAEFGLIKDWDGAASKRERGWQAVARGYRIVPREGDTEALDAARQLDRVHMGGAAQWVSRWWERDEAQLPVRWRAEAGLANTRVRLTLSELQAVEAAIEAVIAPYVRRPEAEIPADARAVRLQRYVLPEADEEEST